MVIAMDGKTGIQGSGVIVGPNRVVTNCHVVLRKGGGPRSQINVIHQNQNYQAQLVNNDVQYDTCLLVVPKLTASPATIANISSLRVGQRVYAIGAPSGLELTLTDGLISSLRIVDRTQVIQTSTPISPGSSGGGLFDENGDLIGITSFFIRSGNGLNFAYRADRILSLVSLASTLGESRKIDQPATQVSDWATPDPQFPSVDEKIEWISGMSQRLEQSMPDKAARLEFLKTVYQEGHRANLDPQLVLAFIDAVSGFRKYAVSPSGARGYMQVMPFWVGLIGQKEHDLFHLRINLRYGCTILHYYLDNENGDIIRALLRYQKDISGNDAARTANKDGKFPSRVRKLWQTKWYWKQFNTMP
jgi:hypothetical protein